MSKKHFEALAEMVRTCARNYDERTHWAQSLADVCEQFNPAFDRVRFLRACHLAGETIREVA